MKSLFFILLCFCLNIGQPFAQERSADLDISDLKVTDLELSEFKTDYCTMFFEGTVTRPGVWKECCFNHDLRYWFGGAKKEQLKSDQLLKQCVRKKAGSFWANLMYSGVRAGHYSPIKNKYQWGWGWSKNRKPFKALTRKEKEYIRDELGKLNLEESFLRGFIKRYHL